MLLRSAVVQTKAVHVTGEVKTGCILGLTTHRKQNWKSGIYRQ